MYEKAELRKIVTFWLVHNRTSNSRCLKTYLLKYLKLRRRILTFARENVNNTLTYTYMLLFLVHIVYTTRHFPAIHLC